MFAHTLPTQPHSFSTYTHLFFQHKCTGHTFLKPLPLANLILSCRLPAKGPKPHTVIIQTPINRHLPFEGPKPHLLSPLNLLLPVRGPKPYTYCCLLPNTLPIGGPNPHSYCHCHCHHVRQKYDEVKLQKLQNSEDLDGGHTCCCKK
jgi:hypothetical protein